MSKKNQLRNRLDDLFADMGDDISQALESEQKLTGWTWECDAQGAYTACSSEVKDILGLEPDSFLGQPLADFHVSADYSELVKQTLEKNSEAPIEIDIPFTDTVGDTVLTHIVIYHVPDMGFRGFTHILEEADEVTEPETQTPPEISSRPDLAATPPGSAGILPRRGLSDVFGIAIDHEQITSVSSPYSGAGKQSLKQRQTITNPSAPGIEAALAVPIEMPDQSIGLLEIIDDNLNRDWSVDEQRLVEEVADQLSLALENARLFEETQVSLNRTEALFEVSRAAIAVEDASSLMQNLVDTIAAVLPADRVLLFQVDRERQVVLTAYESHAPQIQISADLFTQLMGGLSGWVIREQKPALSLKGVPDSRESQQAQQFRFESKAGSLMVVPLIYRGQILGTITAINSMTQPDFTQSDVDLLMAMANQVATALANANILKLEQRRRQIASTLSEIARVIGGSLNLEEIAERLLNQLSEVVEFSIASLEIVEGDRRQPIGGISKLGDVKIENRHRLRPIADDPLIRKVVETQEPLVIADTHATQSWDPLPETAHVRSWIAAPLLRGNAVIGLLILDHTVPNAYDEETADLLSAIAAQAAVAIHNARLYQQAQARSTQLQTAAEVSRAASSILDPNPLIQQTVNLIRDRFDLYYVGLFLIDQSGDLTREPGKWAVLRAGTGEAGSIQVERGHKLEIGGASMIGQCISTTEPQISQSIMEEGARFINPLLPETRSEMALPLISRGEAVGAMTIQSTQVTAFSDEDIAILQTMADQVANALQNASLFDQIQIRAEELAVLNEMSRQLTATVDVNAITRNIYLFTSRLIDTSTFFIALYDESTDQISYPLCTEENQEIELPPRQKGQGMTEYVIDTRQSLLIQSDVVEWVRQQGLDLITSDEDDPEFSESWLGVPMLAGDQVIGVIGVQHNDPHHYNEEDHDLLVAIASQSAIAFQNASLFAETRQRTEDLAVLNEMGRVLANLLDINMVTSTVFEFTAKLMDTTNFFIALYDSDTDEVSLPLVSINQERLEIPKRKLGTALTDYVIRNGRPLLLNGDVLEQQEKLGIERHPIGKGLPPLSWLGVPMMIGERVIGVISVQSLTTAYLYQDRHRDLLSSIAGQVAITIQNTRLFDQTQQQLADLMNIQQTTAELSAAITIDDVIHTLLENLVVSVQADLVSMFLLRGNNLIRTGMYPLPTEENILGQTLALDNYPLTKSAIETRRPITLAADDPRLQEHAREAFKAAGIAANMTVPLIGPEGPIGTLSLSRKHPAPLFNQQEVNLLETLASQAAISMQNARLFEQIQQRSEELQLINQVVSRVAASLDIGEGLKIVIGEIGRAVKADSGGVAILNQERTSLTLLADYLPNVGLVSAVGLELPLDSNPASQKIIETRESLLIKDPQNDPLLASIHEPMRQRGIETIMLFPLIVSGEVIGTIGLDFQEKNRELTRSESNLIETIILQTSTAIQNARLFDRVESALNETQTLYDASAALNAVDSFDDILEVMRTHTILAEADNNVSINIFDRPWQGDDMPDWTITIARWSRLPAESLSPRYPLKAFPAAKSLLNPNTPVIIEDVPNATNIDDNTRNLYQVVFQAGSTIFVPLTIAGQWIGYINGIYSEARKFLDEDVRRLTTLAGQATVSIQNIQLLEETRRQLRDLSTISNASQSLSSAPLSTRGVAEIIAKIFIEVMGGASQAAISLLDTSDYQMRVYASLQNVDGEIKLAEDLNVDEFSPSEFPATERAMQEVQPIVLQRRDLDVESAKSTHGLREEVQTLIAIPLAAKGRSRGVIEIEYHDQAYDISSEELNLALTLANQAAVALENAQLYEEQRETTEQLREIDTLKSQFLANMSHELRTPLNSIIGFSRVIMKGIDGPVTDLQQQDLSAIYNAGQHLLNMINDILDISKIEAGKMDLAFDDVKIAEIIESVLSTARGLIKDKSVQLITAIDENLPIVTADPTRVRQILLNLISNAAKFTEEGSIKVEARQRTNKKGNQEIYLAVADTGTGIASEDQHKLFVPFSQVDGSPTRKVEGTGLGLSITRLLVELHGGEIGVISAPGEGSTFWFTLPLPDNLSSSDSDGKSKVVAIDDDTQVINLYERYLSNVGFDVVAVTNPHKALDQIRQTRPFAITLDIMMPDFDGWKLLEDLKADPEIGDIPVVICSILAEYDKGKELGADDYLTKPILEEDLVQALKKLKEKSNPQLTGE